MWTRETHSRRRVTRIGTDASLIRAGNETNLIDTRNGWHKVGIPKTAIEGWIPAGDAEIVWLPGD